MLGCGGATAASGPAPKVLAYQTSAVDPSDLTTYTFSAQAIGTAAADRRVHVGVGATQNSPTISSVVIGGVTATQNIATTLGTASTVGIFTANVPTGTTADVVVTFTGSTNRCGIAVWTSTGLTSDAANATDSGVNDSGSSQDLNCDVATLDGGFIITYAIHHNSSDPGGVFSYSPAAIVGKFIDLIEGTVIQYGGSGPTDGTTFDVRTTSAVGTSNGHSPLVAASF